MKKRHEAVGRVRPVACWACGLALAAALALAACDLPSGPEEARGRLSRGRSRIVALTLPFPALTINLREELSDSANPFRDVIDTADFSFKVEPDPFLVGLGNVLEFEPVDLDPIQQSFDLSIDAFQSTVNITADAVPATLPGKTLPSVPVPAASPAGSFPFTVDFLTVFTSATFAGNSALQVKLTTDAAASLNGVTVTIKNIDTGATIASGGAAIDVPAGSVRTVSVSLSGVALPGKFRLEIAFSSANGDNTPDGLTVEVSFANAAITQATGLDAGRISPVAIRQRVLLDPANAEFSEAVIGSGTIAIKSFSFGSLTFTPSAEFETDLSGKRVGGATPDSVTIAGQIGPPSGATTVNISTSGSLTVEMSEIQVASVTMRTVDFTFDRTVQVVDPNSDDYRGVEEVRVASGSQILLRVTNRLRVGGDVGIRLNGVTDAAGNTLTRTVTIQASSDESPVTSNVTIDLSGTTLRPASMVAQVTGTWTGSNIGVTATAAENALSVDPQITLNASSVKVANAPGLRFDFDRLEPFTLEDLGLEDLVDELDGLELNGVELTLRARNEAAIALALDSLLLTLVNAADTTPVLDAGGQPIRVLVQQGATGRFTVRAGGSDSVTVVATSLINGLIQNVIDGKSVGLLATGRAGFGSATGTLAVGDSLEFSLRVRAPLDLKLPAGGITLDRIDHEAIDLGGTSGDFVADLGEDLVSGSFKLNITNSTPLGLTISVAVARTPADTTGFDPSQVPAAEKFEITGVDMPPAQVDAGGLVTTPSTSTQTVTIPTARLDVFRPVEGETKLSVGIKVVVKPPAGGRAHVSRADFIEVRATGTLQVCAGPAPGSCNP